MRGTTTAPEICAGLYNWQVLGVIFVLHAPIVHCVSWYSSQRPRRKTVILIEVPQAHTAGLSGFSTCWVRKLPANIQGTVARAGAEHWLVVDINLLVDVQLLGGHLSPHSWERDSRRLRG